MHRDPEEELRFATDALARADQIVATQERRIEELRTKGHHPTIAEGMLRVLRQTQEVMRENLEIVESEIMEDPGV